MARQITDRDLSPILESARLWIDKCLVEDGSMFISDPLWTRESVEEVGFAFVDHPDFSKNGFVTKLKGQMKRAAAPAQRLASEMLWALLLFPSNLKATTKRTQISTIWELSGTQIVDDHPVLSAAVLAGVGSGGPGFSYYRPEELAFLIGLARDLKVRPIPERRRILDDYNAFNEWMARVPQDGHRQFRHMLRYFAFPDRVERMSSNNDRHRILEAFGAAPTKEIQGWNDRDLDEALLKIRMEQQESRPGQILDFYEAPLRALWSRDGKVKTLEGEITVTVPDDEDEQEDGALDEASEDVADPRQSIQMQARLAEIGAIMGFRIWLPRSDRGRVREQLPETLQHFLLDELPLNHDATTLGTIEQIDVLWLKGRAIARAFEVEHTTAVYSGLLRMADLLALQPNMDIRLHIVAPAERREKVFREMLRPVFSLLDRGPLSRMCTFISYENVDAIRGIGHLAYTNHTILEQFEEKARIS